MHTMLTQIAPPKLVHPHEAISCAQIWPAAVCLLCQFHVLYACWQKIHDSSTGIPTASDRHDVVASLRALMYYTPTGTSPEIHRAFFTRLRVRGIHHTSPYLDIAPP